jgi:MFS transporter, PPP family, 3-phenylpropionic acid transporter
MPDRKTLLTSQAGYLLLFSTFAILGPYLPLFLRARGFSPSQIGVLMGCMELAGIVGPILLAVLADRRTAYRALLAASLVFSVILLVPLQFSSSLALAVACIAAVGFAYRSSIPLIDSLVGRVLPDPARQYGRVRVAGSVGFVLISVFFQATGLISGDSSLSVLVSFAIMAGLAAAAAALLPAVPAAQAVSPAAQTARDAAGRGAADGFDASFWAVLGVIFLAWFGISAHYSFFSLYLRDRFGMTNVSLIWALGSIAELATVYFSGPLISRFGVRRLLLASLAAITIRLAIYALSPSLAVIGAAQVLHAFTFGTLHTASVAYVNGKIGGNRRGMGIALYHSLGTGVPRFIASSVGGYFLEARGYPALFLVYAAVPLLGIAILAVFGGRLLPVRSSRAG